MRKLKKSVKKAKGCEIREARYLEMLNDKIEKQEFYNTLKFGHASETTEDIMAEIAARWRDEPAPDIPKAQGTILSRIRRQLKTQ